MFKHWFGTKGLILWFTLLVASLGIGLFFTSSQFIFRYRTFFEVSILIFVVASFFLFFISLARSKVSRFSQFILINMLIMACVYSGYTIWQNRDMIKTTTECDGETYYIVERNHLDFMPPQQELAKPFLNLVVIIDKNNNCL
jgi:Ca2+/Na+ antiporter